MYVMPGYNKLTKEELVSSSAPDSATTWDAGTEYVTGDLVRSGGGTLFECAVGPAKFLAGQYCSQPYGIDLPNLNNNPDEFPTVPAMDRTAYPDYVDIDDCYEESGKLWWMKRDDEYENKYRMFAESPELVTKGPQGNNSTLTLTFTTDVRAGNLVAVRTNATKITYSGPLATTEQLTDSSSDNFSDSEMQTTKEWNLIVPEEDRLNGVPASYRNYIMGFGIGVWIPAGSTFTVTLEHDRSEVPGEPFVYIGGLMAGSISQIGTTLYNTTLGIVDYSKKERDAFGRAEIKERGYTNRVNYRVAIPTNKIYATKEFLASVRATLSAYTADLDMPGTVVAGYFRDFSIPYESYTESIFNIEVEGL